MKTTTTLYDVAEHLRTPEDMAAYLEACIEEADGDAGFIARALGDIARAQGMTQVARDLGLSRESLYKGCICSGGGTSTKTSVAAMGLRLFKMISLQPRRGSGGPDGGDYRLPGAVWSLRVVYPAWSNAISSP
jgi:probable addiction module antidote protein